MKKIHLSIRKPCHENWDAMTLTDKGRFCASCQKTVIDFTGMSNRQLVAFFKKNSYSVCGRVYDDQLHRDILIPGNRIPWIKFFFQFTWPALVLLLKSCGMRDNVKESVKTETRVDQPKKVPSGIVGMMLTEVSSIDTAKLVVEEPVPKKELMGDIAFIQRTDSVKKPVHALIEEPDSVYKPMDTVFIQTDEAATTRKIWVGGITACRTETVRQEKDAMPQEVKLIQEARFKAFPNPVRAGSAFTISFETSDDLPMLTQILSPSGQLILQLKEKEKDLGLRVNVQIPSNLPPGIYFLNIVRKDKGEVSTKIIVTR